MYDNIDGYYNNAFGNSALMVIHTSGYNNTAVGSDAL
jgi:hypothetical protein